MTTAATLLFDTASPATKPAAAISGATGPNAAAQAPFAALLADGGVLQVSNLGQLVAANAPVSGSDFLGLGIVDGADRPLEGEAGVFALLTSTALTAPAPTAKAPGGLLGAALPATPLTGHAPAAPASPQHATAAAAVAPTIVPQTKAGAVAPVLSPLASGTAIAPDQSAAPEAAAGPARSSDVLSALTAIPAAASKAARAATAASPAFPASLPLDHVPTGNAILAASPARPVMASPLTPPVTPTTEFRSTPAEPSMVAALPSPRPPVAATVDDSPGNRAISASRVAQPHGTVPATVPGPVEGGGHEPGAANVKPAAPSPVAKSAQPAEVTIEKVAPVRPAPSLVASISGNAALVATESRSDRSARPAVSVVPAIPAAPAVSRPVGHPAPVAPRPEQTSSDAPRAVPTADNGVKVEANSTALVSPVKSAGANHTAAAPVTTDGAAPAAIVEATDQGAQTRGLTELRPDSVTPATQQTVRATAAASEIIAQLNRPAAPVQPPAEQVALQLRNAIARGLDRIQIQLKPASLGHIDVTLDISSTSRVAAVVTVERPETLELLQRDARGLERALQDAGLRTDSGSLNFNLRGDGQQSANNEFAPAPGGPDADDSGETGDGGDKDQAVSHQGTDRALDIAV